MRSANLQLAKMTSLLPFSFDFIDKIKKEPLPIPLN